MRVKKAVIPAAGLGTRVLPATKAVPKEMLHLVDKPVIQYIVEEAVAAGITDILIITSRGKATLEDHFDRSPELEARLAASGKTDALKEMRRISEMANIHYVRQGETKGLGHAVLCARSFVGNEPFAVLYGDGVIVSERPAIGELCAAFATYQKGVVGVQPVELSAINRYGSVSARPLADRIFAVDDMIEKPRPEEALSPYAVLDRCVLPPSIFDILDRTPPGVGGEIQLTDAMRVLCHTEGMIAVHYEGDRYDMGNKLEMLKASVELGLRHPELGAEFALYLKNMAKKAR
jgi:UTP--glucose-1-phosphate uridylyltransferase